MEENPIQNNYGSILLILTFSDNESPSISCPANQTVATDPGQDYARVALPAEDSASDNSGVYTISIHVNGSTYNVGDNVTLDLATSPHLVQYIATDSSSNTAICDVFFHVVGKCWVWILHDLCVLPLYK